MTVGLAEDPPFQVSVFTGYEESNWSAPAARVLYLVVDLAAASPEDAVVEARHCRSRRPATPWCSGSPTDGAAQPRTS